MSVMAVTVPVIVSMAMCMTAVIMPLVLMTLVVIMIAMRLVVVSVIMRPTVLMGGLMGGLMGVTMAMGRLAMLVAMVVIRLFVGVAHGGSPMLKDGTGLFLNPPAPGRQTAAIAARAARG